MIGKNILHYKIIEKLGEGGMGVVYLADDTKLKRQVAIKFLPRHITSSSDERKRFEIEAQAAAALNHPNIATIFAIEEAEDNIFLVMEYITGKHLKDHIKNQPLSVDEAIKIAIQIAEGLQAAHKKGIVHRDIKSANIMSDNDGNIKIMDFGLAKFGGSVQLTQIGTTLGTAAYMSPEQAKGEEVDHRADIWSFGVVLYEMLSGTLPFKGDYEQAVIFNILNESPADIEKERNAISNNLNHIILKCLQKKPEERYQDFSQVLIDLKLLNGAAKNAQAGEKSFIPPKNLKSRKLIWVSAVFVTIALLSGYFIINSGEEQIERIPIAVVDFDNQTKESELNGLSGLLITALEQSQRLTVITRSRMLDILKHLGKEEAEFIDEKLGVEICKQANIEALAIASIRKLGNRYAIDLKVLDPQKNIYLFTAKEEGVGQESVFAMIDNLAEKTRAGLKEKASQINNEKQKVANVVTTNLEAYQHYFKGEELISKLEFINAEDEFRKAIAIDSTFALAYYRLAYAIMWWGGEKAKVYIRKAMSFIQNLPEKESLYIQAMSTLIEGETDQALTVYKKILSIYPDEKEALYQIGDWSFHETEYDTSLKYLEKALAIDPLFESAYQHIIWTYGSMGQYEKALEYCHYYITRIPRENAYKELGETYYRSNDLENSLRTFKKALDIFPTNPSLINALGELYIFRNEYARAEIEFKKLTTGTSSLQTKGLGYKYLAILSAYLGSYQNTLKMLDHKIEIDMKLNDSTSLAADYAEKAFWLLTSTKNNVKANQELEKGFKLQKVANEHFFKPLFNYYISNKEYQKAVLLAQKQLDNLIFQIIAKAHLDKSIGKNSEAIEGFKKGVLVGLYRSPTSYDLGQLYFELEQYENALQSIKIMQETYQEYDDFPSRALQYPRSFYLLGQIYEKLNDTKSAIESYQRLLDLWKDADNEIPELIDTKKRLANLKGNSAK